MGRFKPIVLQVLIFATIVVIGLLWVFGAFG